MIVRYLVPGIVWCLIMWLLFLTPVATPMQSYGGVPARSLIHGVLFLGFTHLWLGGFKKQLRFERWRDNAFAIVLGGALVTATISEILIHHWKLSPGTLGWNLLFDTLGTGAGMVSFKLLYHKCY